MGKKDKIKIKKNYSSLLLVTWKKIKKNNKDQWLDILNESFRHKKMIRPNKNLSLLLWKKRKSVLQ